MSQFLRAYKGNILTVLLVLAEAYPDELSATDVEKKTGVQRHTAGKALASLVDDGLAVRIHSRAWRLSENGSQKLSGMFDHLNGGKPSTQQKAEGDEESLNGGKPSTQKDGPVDNFGDNSKEIPERRKTLHSVEENPPLSPDHDDDDHHDIETRDGLVNQLAVVGFDDAVRWVSGLTERQQRLARDWLIYYDGLPSSKRGKRYTNFPGYLRGVVLAGQPPPQQKQTSIPAGFYSDNGVLRPL